MAKILWFLLPVGEWLQTWPPLTWCHGRNLPTYHIWTLSLICCSEALARTFKESSSIGRKGQKCAPSLSVIKTPNIYMLVPLSAYGGIIFWTLSMMDVWSLCIYRKCKIFSTSSHTSLAPHAHLFGTSIWISFTPACPIHPFFLYLLWHFANAPQLA